jgi:hypothetical protein
MGTNAIFLPGLAMALLTFAVWWRMYFTRIGQMKRERIHPQSVALSSQAATRLTDSRAADNFRNLFELPVLFYLAVVVAAQAGLATTPILLLAWLFVLLRFAHSWIQCTYNKVMHRFYVYVAGGMVLWAMWGVLGYGLLRA